ncbi:uncharacterized protein LOC123677569 isoform X2 [Harmonia axyridis]|uniref:uncharacterized protein LOC123677569 isoform X2 n=1 Tax=Harmonia axyridis TaxID=115357 RepID=UPI001E278FD0|nr:uncharacterized protein LOC123677569 isoform X2 [Harmonia axyridis]
MDQKNYAFRYPPPPPPNYIPTIIPPLPTDSPPIVKPPPPPPPTTVQNWTNWSVDFSRPPPPVFSGLMTGNNMNTLKLAYNTPKKTVVSPSMSPASSTDSSGYYGNSPSDNSQYYGTENRQYRSRYNTDQYGSSQSWSPPKSIFKRPRYETRLDQRGESYDNYAKYNDLKYTRNTTNIDSRYSRDINNVDSKNHRPNEEVQRSKKRKKPLSQSVPAKRAWTDEEAQMAIVVEREYNKLFKNHSLKIKFPDQELNRDIVSKFHSSIETVYFQQPSNPRFCFVTLADGAEPNNVIEELNKIKFGLGYLSAEYKKDREEEQNVGPEDIDPLTLYVGNLAQEVTKEDMVTFFPKNKRIDIGFAKKMRYTRYAFVSFKNVQDSIEAFKATHYADLHSKSMIVRFRRLHGTVGMPGEAKSFSNSKENQEEKKKEDSASTEKVDGSDNSQHKEPDESDSYSASTSYDPQNSSPSHSPNPNNCDRRTTSESSEISNFDPSLVKSEPYDYNDEDYEDCQVEKTEEQFTPTQISSEEITVPEIETTVSDNISLEAAVKKEPELITPFASEIPESHFPIRPIPLKKEPNDNGEVNTISSNQQINEEFSLPNGLKEPKIEAVPEILEPVNPDDNEEEFNTTTDFGSVLDNLQRRPFMP